MAEKKINVEMAQKIQELQILEQNIQNMLLQKQAFQLELNETNNALEEIKKTKDDIYKIVGQVMVKTKKEDIEKELKQKQEIINLRIKNIEKQENFLREQIEKKRQEVIKKIK